MLHKNFILRQLARSRKQTVLFLLCVVLSTVTLVALNGFGESVNESVLKDARKLQASDITIRSSYAMSRPVAALLESLEARGEVETAKAYQFSSVVRAGMDGRSLLASVKVVEPGYPFYGTVDLQSGKPLHDVLTPGSIVVEQSLLDRLRLEVGDPLHVGDATLTIRDVVLREPDRTVSFFLLGPRVFVAAGDLDALGLVTRGSRVSHATLVKVADPNAVEDIAARLRSASRGETQGRERTEGQSGAQAAVQDDARAGGPGEIRADHAQGGHERVETFRSARSRMKKFFDNFLFFLNLTGIFTLLLAGIGIQSAVSAFLKEQETTVGVMKALGASSRFVIMNFITVLLAPGVVGALAGLAGGYLLQAFLPALFKGLLPSTVTLAITWRAAAQGFVLGLLVVALFTFLPLYRLKSLKPAVIFRMEEQPRPDEKGPHSPPEAAANENRRDGDEPGGRLRRRLGRYARIGNPRVVTGIIGASLLSAFTAMVLRQLEDLKVGIYFVTAVAVLLLLVTALTEALLRVLKRYPLPTLPARQAVKGLFRPRNSTRLIVVTLAASLSVIFTITVVERNLDAAFVQFYPEGAPNVFFIDIQPSQLDDFKRELGMQAEYYPVVRARVVSVNGKSVNLARERERRGDNLAREFNLTYRDHLLRDEEIVKGKSLHGSVEGDAGWTAGPAGAGGESVPVSVLDSFADDNAIEMGDEIAFNIQGAPIQAKVSSIRSRTGHFIQPFFYFVFPEQVLKDAPHTVFTAVRVDAGRIAGLQDRMVSRFPNVSVVNVTEAAKTLAEMMHKMSRIVRFFTSFSFIAGILIIISSVLATRSARVRQAVYYKILGAKAAFVLRVFALESIFLGAAGASLALVVSQTAGWIICSRVFELPYRPFWGTGIVMAAAAVLVVVSVGLLASIPILKKRPAVFLREQSEE